MIESRTIEKRLHHDGIKFIFYPIILFIVAAVLFFAVLYPLISPYKDLINMMSFREPPQFDPEHEGLFNEALATQRTVIPGEGEEYGTISIPSVGIEAPLIYGDGPTELRSGVGTYIGTSIPGQRRTVLLAGHNNRFFRTLPDAVPGDIVSIETYYGVFCYEITDSKVARFDDTSAFDLYREEENLIMYTCHNSIQFGATPWRQFVYAKYLPDKSRRFDEGKLL
jgi:sortase A